MKFESFYLSNIGSTIWYSACFCLFKISLLDMFISDSLFFLRKYLFPKTKSLPLQLCLCNYFTIAWKCSAWPAVLSALNGFRVSQTMCGEGVSETTFPPKPLTASSLRLGIPKKKVNK